MIVPSSKDLSIFLCFWGFGVGTVTAPHSHSPIPPHRDDWHTAEVTDVTQTPFQTTGMGLGPERLQFIAKMHDFCIFFREKFHGSFPCRTVRGGGGLVASPAREQFRTTLIRTPLKIRTPQ